jgi:hypothetical protein
MRYLELGPASGKLASIAAEARGLVVAYQVDDARGQIVEVSLFLDGVRRVSDATHEAGGPAAAFPTLGSDELGTAYLAWRTNPTSAGVLRNLATGTERSIGTLYGNNPVCFGEGHLARQFTAAFDVIAEPLRGGEQEVLNGRGAGTGLSHIAGGHVFTMDAVYRSEAGMVNPQRAGGCVVGENADDGPAHVVARLDNGHEAVLWPGHDSFTPKIVVIPGGWAVVTWGKPGGVRLVLITAADFAAPVPPPQPPPIPEPPRPPEPPPPVPNPHRPESPRMTREQFFAAFRAVNDFYAAEDGLQRPGGMVIGGACDTEAMAAWGFDLLSGVSVDAVKNAIRGSQEWRDKHPGPR